MTNHKQPTQHHEFKCPNCGTTYATKNPNTWLISHIRLHNDGSTRRYCDCGQLLATASPSTTA